MENSRLKLFLNLFHLVCILSTTGITLWCCHKYMLNKDASVIDLIPFNADPKSPYPSVSLCFFDPCIDQRLKYMESNLTCKDYYDMHNKNGPLHDDFLSMNYEDFTINIGHHLDRTEVHLENGSTYVYYPGKDTLTSHFLHPPYRAFTEPSIKCYTFVTPYLQNKIIDDYSIYLNKTMLPYLNEIGIAISYRNQILQRNVQLKMIENYLNLNETESRGGMEIQVLKVGRINLRNKLNPPCDEDWLNEDLKVLEKTAEKVRCRHPHLNVSPHLPQCTNVHELRNFTWRVSKIFYQPCISIIDSSMEILWDQDGYQHKDLFRIKVQFLATQVHETLQVTYSRCFHIKNLSISSIFLLKLS